MLIFFARSIILLTKNLKCLDEMTKGPPNGEIRDPFVKERYKFLMQEVM